MLIIAIAFGAFCATLAGGLLALRLRDRLHLVLGFSAGAVIAVAFFDLLPEAIALGGKYHSPATLMGWAAVGFLFYLVLDRIQLHYHQRGLQRGHDHHDHGHHDHGHHGHGHPDALEHASMQRASLGAGSLSAHSFLDGVAIGLGFQASAAIGAVVAIAVLTHDFSDGINTMNMVLKNGGDRRQALRWLLIDALAPAIGLGSTFFFTLPDQAFGVVLALFGGFFLYIGASDLIPESYHAHPKFLTTAMTVLGAAVLYLTIAIAG
jgi:ZIP family zinc transporter